MVLVSLVVPVYNEEIQIEKFVEASSKILSNLSINYEIVFIDDGSTDGTWKQLLKMGKENENIRAIRLSRNFGKESALNAGIEASFGDAIITMDVDFQHPPELLPEIIYLWRNKGYKIVEARKIDRGCESFWRRFVSKAFYLFMNKNTGFDLTGATDYKLLDRTIVEIWKIFPEKITFFKGISAWMGFERATVDFSVPKRVIGETRWSSFRLARLAINAITSFTAMPLHIVTILGIVFLLFSLILGIQTLFMYFSHKSVDGFTTVILLQLIVGSCSMLGLGILGLYVSKLYEEVKGRPRYIISERFNFPNVIRLDKQS